MKYVGAGVVVAAAAAAGAYSYLGQPKPQTQTPTVVTEPKPAKLLVQGHEVHRKAAVGANVQNGVDLVARWKQNSGIDIEWRTLPNDQQFDMLMRETATAETSLNVAGCLDPWFAPRVANLFEPLEGLMQKAPLEDFNDIIPATLNTATVQGKLYGIPMRATGNCSYYHKGYFEDKGVGGPPKTMEDLYEIAKQLTFTKPTGEKVYGWTGNMDAGNMFQHAVWFARGWDGDIVTSDYKVACDQPPMINGLTLLARMYKEGLIPPNFSNVGNEAHVNLITKGQSAQFTLGISYCLALNDPKTSKAAGQIQLANSPPAAEFKTKWEGTRPSFTATWSWIIPKNTKYKPYGWDFIKYLSNKDSQRVMSTQGTDESRFSVYADPSYKDFWKNQGFPTYPDILANVLKYGRPPLPGMDNFGQVSDLFAQQATAAISGNKTPEKAMADAAAAIKPLLPTPQ